MPWPLGNPGAAFVVRHQSLIGRLPSGGFLQCPDVCPPFISFEPPILIESAAEDGRADSADIWGINKFTIWKEARVDKGGFTRLSKPERGHHSHSPALCDGVESGSAKPNFVFQTFRNFCSGKQRGWNHQTPGSAGFRYR